MAKKALRRLLGALARIAAALLALNAWRAGTWFNSTALTGGCFDVGQGDAVFIDAPNIQVLVDGGPGTAVLEKLSSVLPPWDRSIDLMIATHPHADHVEGRNAVLENYDVGTVVDSGVSYGEAPALAFDALNGSRWWQRMVGRGIWAMVRVSTSYGQKLSSMTWCRQSA